MTKKEAIEAILKGVKVKHWLFSEEEYLYLDEEAFKDEKGLVLDWFDFWKYKQHKNFDNGWSEL